MPVIRIEAPISFEQLVQAVEQLPDEELARFAEQVRALRLRRGYPPPGTDEQALLARIARRPTEAEETRYAELLRLRDAEQLTEQDHAELIALSDRRELLAAERLAAAADLARLRRVRLGELSLALGLVATRFPPVKASVWQ